MIMMNSKIIATLALCGLATVLASNDPPALEEDISKLETIAKNHFKRVRQQRMSCKTAEEKSAHYERMKKLEVKFDKIKKGDILLADITCNLITQVRTSYVYIKILKVRTAHLDKDDSQYDADETHPRYDFKILTDTQGPGKKLKKSDRKFRHKNLNNQTTLGALFGSTITKFYKVESGDIKRAEFPKLEAERDYICKGRVVRIEDGHYKNKVAKVTGSGKEVVHLLLPGRSQKRISVRREYLVPLSREEGQREWTVADCKSNMTRLQLDDNKSWSAEASDEEAHTKHQDASENKLLRCHTWGTERR